MENLVKVSLVSVKHLYKLQIHIEGKQRFFGEMMYIEVNSLLVELLGVEDL